MTIITVITWWYLIGAILLLLNVATKTLTLSVDHRSDAQSSWPIFLIRETVAFFVIVTMMIPLQLTLFLLWILMADD